MTATPEHHVSAEAKMKPEPKRMWVEELRSDRHEQGTGYLNAGNKKCCLGVLCEVAVREGVIPPGVINDTNEYMQYGANKRNQFPPNEVLEWAGLTTKNDNGETVVVDDPEVQWVNDEDEAESRSLSDLNDASDADFHDIAALIEAQL